MASATSAASFFMRLLGRAVRLRVTRAHREMPEAKPMQQLADAALMQVHAKYPGNLPAQVAATPAYDAIRLKLRSSANPVGDIVLLHGRARRSSTRSAQSSSG